MGAKSEISLIRCDVQIRRNNDILLITGDGKTLPTDLRVFRRMFTRREGYDTMCIGRSIQLADGPVQHYADVDADAGKWVAENLFKNHPLSGRPIRHTLGDVAWFDACWDIDNCPIPSDEVMWHGSTALFGVWVGLALGYSDIVLAGVPMDSKGHWYFPDQTVGPKWTAETYQAWFEFAATAHSIKVKSLSGYTAMLLGRPCYA